MSESPVMTCEEYCASQGYPALGYAEPALHRQPRSDAKLRKKNGDRIAVLAAEYDAARLRMREQYWRLVSEGAIREPTRIERLRDRAAGHPDNEATQAAIRLLTKLEGPA